MFYFFRSPLPSICSDQKSEISENDDTHGPSPPLELRRPGSGPRIITVPHSIQSPQDRATGKFLIRIN